MKLFRNAGFGLLVAGFTTLLVFGAFSIAFTEGMGFLPTPLATPTQGSLLVVVSPEIPEISTQPIVVTQPENSQPSSTQAVQVTATQMAPTICPPPKNWITYLVKAGDTLQALAASHNTSVNNLIQANCLLSQKLMPGTILYLPKISATDTPSPTELPSKTVVPCGPPLGWVPYIIQPGDTLFRLSLAFGVSVPQLQQANCLGNSTFIRAGDILYVPNVPTRTPTRTLVPTSTPTPLPSPTKTLSLGTIQIQKIVDWNGSPTDTSVSFTICISGPTYPNGKCKSIGWQGGTLTWSNLSPGSYAVSENNPGSNWDVSIANNLLEIGSSGGTVTTSITNRKQPAPASLTVKKIVNWNGVTQDTSKTFEICITGPSYSAPNCQNVGANGGTLKWSNLNAGTYTVSETNPGSEWIIDPGSTSVTLSNGQNQTVTFSNTRKLGGISLSYFVDWKGVIPDPTQTFEVCASGASPSCQMTGGNSGVLTWSNVIPGIYNLSVTNAGPEWTVIFTGSPVTVPADGGTGSATLTIEHN